MINRSKIIGDISGYLYADILKYVLQH